MRPVPFSDAHVFKGALFWDRRRPRLLAFHFGRLVVTGQARTPAVPEEGVLKNMGVTKGNRCKAERVSPF